MNDLFESYMNRLAMPKNLSNAVISIRRLCMEAEGTRQLSDEITPDENAMVNAVGRDIIRKVTEYMEKISANPDSASKYMNRLFLKRSKELAKNSENSQKYVDILKNSLCHFAETSGLDSSYFRPCKKI